MAVGWIYLRYLQQCGIFKQGTATVLDIGYQNLFSIPVDEGIEFAAHNGCKWEAWALRLRIEELAARSVWPSGVGEPVYLQELLALTSLQYHAYDIFPGEHVEIFDLNQDQPRPAHREGFDCVLNFGTTEHVFNQYNSFKVIHDVTRAGGYMFHQVPTVGYMNHGYWTYSPRTLLELAAANQYIVRAFWVTGPQGASPLDEAIACDELLWDNALPENFRAAWPQCPVPNGLINALLQKRESSEFRLSLDTTTSAGAPAQLLAQRYARTDDD